MQDKVPLIIHIYSQYHNYDYVIYWGPSMSPESHVWVSLF